MLLFKVVVSNFAKPQLIMLA